jgi:ParB family chromosome partitioning protein
MKKNKTRKLGAGLGALLSGPDQYKEKGVTEVDIKSIQPGQYQPRSNISDQSLKELADTIKTSGVIQPIVIRKINPDGDVKYEIIAGERRWRASQIAGLDTIPAILKKVSDKETIAMALIENIQREELNAVEEAIALQRLITEFEMTHESAAHAVGKSRSSVTNLLRLLELETKTRSLLEDGKLEMGHARALLSVDKNIQFPAAQHIIKAGLNVRQTEKYLKHLNKPSEVKLIDEKNKAITASFEQKCLEKLRRRGKVKIDKNNKSSVTIYFDDTGQLDDFLDKL